jgi:superfamily II DNA or RNA helicase
MINLVCDNIWVTVQADDAVHNLLLEELRTREPGYEYSYLFKSKKWDGYTRLYNRKTCQFRRGLLNRAIKLLKGKDVRISYNLSSSPTTVFLYDESKIKPYVFQKTIVQNAVSNDIGILVSPTGSGKTVSIAMTINKVSTRTMVLVTDLVLLDQMRLALQEYYKNPIGMVGDGIFDLQDITVSTVQSLQSIQKAKTLYAADKHGDLNKHLETVGMVIFDEVHRADSKGINELMPMFKNTRKFIGFSATPYTIDDENELDENLILEQNFGTVLYDTKSIDMIKEGLKVPAIISVVEHEPINTKYLNHKKKLYGKSVNDSTKNYREALEVEILNNAKFHEKIANQAINLMNDGKSVFVYATHSVKYGEDIQKLIPGSVLINGSTPRIERAKIYDNMRSKKILCIVSDIGGTGLNIPSLDAIVLASDVKDVRQLIGRVTRAAINKSVGFVIDNKINTMFLKKHAEIRRAQYEAINATII